MNVHQLRATPCPCGFLLGYYWYGRRQHSFGKVPQWLDKLSIGEAVKDGHNSEEFGDINTTVSDQ